MQLDGATLASGPGREPVRVGVSSCLLGNKVRYDGGHKRDGFLVETFGRYVDWLPVCPEMEFGLGTPRPSLRLERSGDDVRLVMPKTGQDHTDAMRRYASKRAAWLAADGLCGFVFKKDSPSCGVYRVKVYDGNTMPARTGRGLFAEALMRRHPNLPVEEEGRLNDPMLRENFVERVFAYQRLRSLFEGRWTIGKLVAFHTAHKLQLLAHAPKRYEQLGRLVAGAKGMARAELRERYEAEFMSALALVATRKRHVNVLQHIIGYFKKQLDDASRRELLGVVEDYRAGLVPLVVPLILIRHYVRRFDLEYLKGQLYLDPHPKELMLRNHV
jgi:uncharacterized protein YbgA (DUF1722 family)/uncharacterized protein YbbK (DUF523 family)